MPPSQRIVVVGGVAAGTAAAAQAKRTDPEADVVLYERDADIAYGACEMPYYVADWIDRAEDLVLLTPEQFAETRGVDVRVQHEVTSIDTTRGHLTAERLTDGAAIEDRFDKLILATGARARRPDLDGLDAPNVFPLRRLSDARALKAYLDTHEVRHAVIMGGGYIGIEMAEALRARGARVSILDPIGLLGTYLDASMRPRLVEAVSERGVIVRTEQVTALERGGEGRVQALRTDAGELVGCDLLVYAIGVVPNVELGQRAGVRVGPSGACAADVHMRTNLPNVWVCGDCAEVRRVIDDRPVHLALSPNAFRTARVAGTNAARRGRGPAKRFPGVCLASAVRAFGLEVARVGLNLEEAEEAGFNAFAHTIEHWSRTKHYPGSKRMCVRLIVEQRRGRLLGAELLGEDGVALRANVLVPLIREGWDVDAMSDLDLVYNPPVAPSIDPLLIAAHEAAKRVDRSWGASAW